MTLPIDFLTAETLTLLEGVSEVATEDLNVADLEALVGELYLEAELCDLVLWGSNFKEFWLQNQSLAKQEAYEAYQATEQYQELLNLEQDYLAAAEEVEKFIQSLHEEEKEAHEMSLYDLD